MLVFVSTATTWDQAAIPCYLQAATASHVFFCFLSCPQQYTLHMLESNT